MKQKQIIPALWSGATRVIGGVNYHVFDDGSLRHATPQIKGKTAVKAAKRARMKARVQ